jgi:molybdenum ABC transporter ATP-binding protein
MIDICIRKRLRHFDLRVSCRIDPGEVVVVVGPSGSGKTTLLNCIAGLTAPDWGRIQLGDRVVFESATGTDLPPRRRQVGFVFQDYALFPHLTVFENVAYGLRARRLPHIVDRVGDVLTLLGIGHLAEARPAQLSGGEKQRVALARAVAFDASVLLLDEPLGALDAGTRQAIRKELKGVLGSLHATALVVSHDYEDALALGTRIMVMERGAVAQFGTRQDLLYRPRSRFVAQFTGVNYFEGRAVTHADHGCEIDVGTARLSAACDSTGDVSASFFPSDVTLSATRPDSSARNVFHGVVRDVVDLGDRVRVHVDGALPLVAEVTPRSFEALALAAGRPVYAFFKATAVRVASQASASSTGSSPSSSRSAALA